MFDDVLHHDLDGTQGGGAEGQGQVGEVGAKGF